MGFGPSVDLWDPPGLNCFSESGHVFLAFCGSFMLRPASCYVAGWSEGSDGSLVKGGWN